MTGLEQAISQYGYLAVFAGAVLEGETVLFAGAMAAGGGLLELWGVGLAACLGGCTSDLIFYLLGLTGGRRVLSRLPRLMAKSNKIRGRVSRHAAWVILASRFAYGLRSVIPLACSLSGVRPAKFIPLNLVSGLAWAAFYSLVGAGLGEWIAERISRPGGLWLGLGVLTFFALCCLAAAGFLSGRMSRGGSSGEK